MSWNKFVKIVKIVKVNILNSGGGCEVMIYATSYQFHRYALLQNASTDEGLTSPKRSDKDRLMGSPTYDTCGTQLCVPYNPLVECNNSLLVVDL